jgi:hypothetical protein
MPLLTAADLQKLCHDAFRQHPHSCSHAVWHVMNGALRPPLAPYHFRQANQLIDFLNNAPFWTAVTLQKAGVYANAGAVVIGGTKDDPNGHVIIVYPGPPKPAGGYHFTNRQGSLTFLPPRGLYPLAMSTSIGRAQKATGTRRSGIPGAPTMRSQMLRFGPNQLTQAASQRANHRPTGCSSATIREGQFAVFWRTALASD